MMNNLATKMTTTKAPPMTETKITARNVQVFYGDKHALKDVSIDIRPRTVTAFIGPSGCGKSTFLRCINRMNDTIASCRVEGDIHIDAENIYDSKVDPVQLRAKVGMVAFVREYPAGPPDGFFDPASALPVQVYNWTQRGDPAFVERASGAIIVLLVFLIVMNLIAIILRRRFERRW